MQKQVYIVHGWGGYPEEGWFPWLKKELEKQGFVVYVPQLPKPEEPRINTWVPALAKAVQNVDENTFFIGHSMGCQTIARYLATLSDEQIIGGAIYVAGFFKELTGLDDDEITKSVCKEWLTTPLAFAKIKKHCPKSVAIFSDDDPYVPMNNQEDFKNKLDAKIIVEHNQGHFSGSTGTTALPIALNSLLEIS